MDIRDLLRLLGESGASDLHLAAARPPVLRINGELTLRNHADALTLEDVTQALIDLHRRGLISLEDALCACRDHEVVKRTVTSLEGTIAGFDAHPGPAFHRAGVL